MEFHMNRIAALCKRVVILTFSFRISVLIFKFICEKWAHRFKEVTPVALCRFTQVWKEFLERRIISSTIKHPRLLIGALKVVDWVWYKFFPLSFLAKGTEILCSKMLMDLAFQTMEPLDMEKLMQSAKASKHYQLQP